MAKKRRRTITLNDCIERLDDFRWMVHIVSIFSVIYFLGDYLFFKTDSYPYFFFLAVSTFLLTIIVTIAKAMLLAKNAETF